MFESLRERRITVGRFSGTLPEHGLSVFIGLYNAEPYLQSLLLQLQSQTVSLPLVVVDNQSTDNTWQLIQAWSEVFSGRVLLVRNAINLGGTGTLLTNLDLIPTRWVATMHQDDFYKSSHLQTLQSAVATAKDHDIAFATDMGSMDSLGNRTTVPPRASWFLPDSSRATLFLSNLRLHNFPFPSAAFRVDALSDARVPWHSTVFPDTELVLNWSLMGDLVHLPSETMLYRENPASESHSVVDKERQIGTYTSLTRIFSSTNFQNLASDLSQQERTAFFRHLAESLVIRLGEGQLAKLLTLQVAEICASAWDYSVSSANKIIRDCATMTASYRTSDLIESLSRFYEDALEIEDSPSDHLSANPEQSVPKSGFMRIGASILGRLPYVIRKEMTIILGRNRLAKKPGSPWNFFWRE